MLEHFFICPNCLQNISVLVDPSVSDQHYIEDCEVCCRPLQLDIVLKSAEIIRFDAQLAQ